MMFGKPVVNYGELRLNNINSSRFRHVKLLLYWPVYGMLFVFVERFYHVDSYFSTHCALDDLIPFSEWFLIPYLFWFVALVGMHLYLLMYDIDGFQKFMKFVIISWTLSIVIFLVFPTCQDLRPDVLPRNNLLSRCVRVLYLADTNTNVFPSVHVIGAVAISIAGWNSRHFATPGWRILFSIITGLICLSTVFLKQHSVIDVLGAVPVCVISYFFSYGHGILRLRGGTSGQ